MGSDLSRVVGVVKSQQDTIAAIMDANAIQLAAIRKLTETVSALTKAIDGLEKRIKTLENGGA